jgi:hypothetical protein
MAFVITSGVIVVERWTRSCKATGPVSLFRMDNMAAHLLAYAEADAG